MVEYSLPLLHRLLQLWSLHDFAGQFCAEGAFDKLAEDPSLVWTLIDALSASSQSCTEIGPSPEPLSIMQVVPSKAHRESTREGAASSGYAKDEDMDVESCFC